VIRLSERRQHPGNLKYHGYIPDIPIDDKTIAELVRMATQAPSAYNMQNWRFIAVRFLEGKTLLKTAAKVRRPIEAALSFT